MRVPLQLNSSLAGGYDLWWWSTIAHNIGEKPNSAQDVIDINALGSV
jgi:hypothetical protein